MFLCSGRRHRIRIAVVSAALLLLSACAAPESLRPRVALRDPATLDSGPLLNADAANNRSAAPVVSDWWRAYADPQLDALIAAALRDHPSLSAAQARVRRAAAGVALAQSRLAPQLEGAGEFVRSHFTERQFIPPPFAGNDYWDNKLLLQASYALDLWGKDREADLSAQAQAQASAIDTAAVSLNLQTAIVRTYIDLAVAYALRDVADATLQQREQVARITTQRLAAGIGNEVDAAEAQSVLPALRAEREQVQARIDALSLSLAALSGQGPGAATAIARPTLALQQSLPLPAALPAHLVGLRPDLAAQRWRLDALTHGIKIARAEFYPDINLQAYAGFQSLDFGHLLGGDSLLTGFGPALSLPIFNGGRLRAQLGARVAAYDEAAADYNHSVLNALQQCATAISDLRSLDKQIRDADAARDSADHAYAVALSGFRAGLSEYLSVLNTQTAQLDTQRTQARLRGQRLDTYAQLVAALGGGFDTALPSAAAPTPTPTPRSTAAATGR